jgi:hypothetical protein
MCIDVCGARGRHIVHVRVLHMQHLHDLFPVRKLTNSGFVEPLHVCDGVQTYMVVVVIAYVSAYFCVQPMQVSC